MKIISGKYPEEKNWQAWLTFNSGVEINRVFLYRLAAYVRDIVKYKVVIDVGLRTMKQQQILYEAYKNGSGVIAAEPGKSRHNYGLASDFNRLRTENGKGVYPGTINADYDLWKQGKPETLNKYGLRHSVDGEIWHVEPIETKGVSIDNIAWFTDVDDWVNTNTGYPLLQLTTPFTRSNVVGFLQELLGVPADKYFGSDTDKAVKEYQIKNKLVADGIVGTGTWEKLTEKPSCETCEIYKKQISQLEASVSGLQATIKSEQLKHATELSTLQKKVVSISSQVDSLKVQLESEKGKTATLTNNLSLAQTQINSLTKELMLVEADRETKLSDLKQIAKAQIIIEKYK